MHELTHLEQAVLRMLLAGHHPILEALRAQLARVRVVAREGTSISFSTRLDVGRAARPAPKAPSAILDDVHADIVGLNHGAAFALFVVDGFLDRLEGSTYQGEEWPPSLEGFTLHYDDPDRDLSDLG